MNLEPGSSPGRVLLALGVHLYTAIGIVVALFTAIAILQQDYRMAFLAMMVSVLIDATDGTLARAADVRRYTPWIDGRKLDDIVDYVNYTFLPVLLIWRAGWLPEPAWLFCAFPLVASSFAFVHEGAKEESRGFFRGFPSYWNVVAFYLALVFDGTESWWVAGILLALSVLSIAPVRFVYPNRPPCWKPFFLGGAAVWAIVLLIMVLQYPEVSRLWFGLSCVYPALYVSCSFYLDWVGRRAG
ncbi:MAG: hypothetical protein GY768_05140 [Planctomycetaceae bacterium]|nr:hypothetical protein [Planctomycetaceae bacterium]